MRNILEVRLKNTDSTRNYFTEKLNQNKLINEKETQKGFYFYFFIS